MDCLILESQVYGGVTKRRHAWLFKELRNTCARTHGTCRLRARLALCPSAWNPLVSAWARAHIFRLALLMPKCTPSHTVAARLGLPLRPRHLVWPRSRALSQVGLLPSSPATHLLAASQSPHLRKGTKTLPRGIAAASGSLPAEHVAWSLARGCASVSIRTGAARAPGMLGKRINDVYSLPREQDKM